MEESSSSCLRRVFSPVASMWAGTEITSSAPASSRAKAAWRAAAEPTSNTIGRGRSDITRSTSRSTSAVASTTSINNTWGSSLRTASSARLGGTAWPAEVTSFWNTHP